MCQSLYGLDLVAAQVEANEGGKADVGDLFHQCCPVVIIYIIHHLLMKSSVTSHDVMSLSCTLISSVHYPYSK